ncbi:MAG: HTTM domain-containing protein [Candidatus Melainabacteria bacterium]|nr:HTTM domain-containing protein [Candidatus Melainabacteria bacterium]
MSFRELADLWYRIWFTPQSPAPICLFRILIGVIILASSLFWWPDLLTWFGYDGIVSVDTMYQFEESNRLSILAWLPPDNRFVVALYALLMVSGICFTLGLKSNLSAFILFVCLTSFHHRNLLIFHSGDTLLRVCMFLLVFGPIGKMYSLDRLLARKSGKEDSGDILCSPWIQNLLRFQVAIVYAHSSLSKLEGETWWNGTAVYYALHMQDFSKFPVPFVFDSVLGCQIATWATLAVEIALFTLIWIKELRYYVLAAGAVLHLGIDWTMNLPFFENLMIATYVLFIKPDDVERFVRFVSQLREPWSRLYNRRRNSP